MRHHETPEVGHWFQDRQINALFEVVNSDVLEDYVEIQYFSGEIDGLDLETWYELDLTPVSAPEDWSGPFEIPKEDLAPIEEAFHPEDWSGPIAEIEPDT